MAAVFALTLVLAAPAAAESTQPETIWIDGHAWDAELQPNTAVNTSMGDHAPLLRGSHYKGHFPDDPDSWVRLSRIDDTWEGLAFLFGRLHALGGEPEQQQVSTLNFSQMETPQCGLDHAHTSADITTESLVSAAMVQAVSVTYDTLCAETVDGTCLMLELELAFDQEFQTDYPDSFQDRAAGIINMVEGFYASQFGIIFDTLSLTFLDTEVFTESTDAASLLGDIRNKRADNRIGFLKSQYSLFHLVSGRSFDGSTAGLAYLRTVCDGNGYGTGITQAFSSDVTTSIVVAHELGHNLGAGHDGPDYNECSTGFIMAPFVDTSAESFSSCSFESVTSRISSLSSAAQCFNFPADAGLSSSGTNPDSVFQGESFTTSYGVDYREASESADRLLLEGRVSADEGRLEAVTLDGVPCLVEGEGTRYSCGDLVPAQDGQQLAIQAVGTGANLSISKTVVLVSASGEVKDVVPGNDGLVSTYSVQPTQAAAPTELAASADSSRVSLDWRDNADNETGYRIERRRDSDAAFSQLVNGLPADTVSFDDTAASDGATWVYRVIAFNAVGDSLPSNTAEALYEVAPAAPAILAATEEERNARLVWTDMATNETGHIIERRGVDSGEWIELAFPGADAETHLDSTVVQGVSYEYRVFAVNSKPSDASNLATFTLSDSDSEGGPGTDTEEPEGQPRLEDSSGSTTSTESSSSSGGGGAVDWLWLVLGTVTLVFRRSRKAIS
ncbi:M12 family metallo-peptidase [Marinobacter sp.]|uniref:M12 family metallo-peptidase n=1 Tax=Marinobacter sp. TaxID=50741 RepID=UPI00384E62D6